MLGYTDKQVSVMTAKVQPYNRNFFQNLFLREIRVNAQRT